MYAGFFWAPNLLQQKEKKKQKRKKNVYTKYFEVFWLCRNAFLHTTKKPQYPLLHSVPPTIAP